jgi:hypothetical protein
MLTPLKTNFKKKKKIYIEVWKATICGRGNAFKILLLEFSKYPCGKLEKGIKGRH